MLPSLKSKNRINISKKKDKIEPSPFVVSLSFSLALSVNIMIQHNKSNPYGLLLLNDVMFRFCAFA